MARGGAQPTGGRTAPRRRAPGLPTPRPVVAKASEPSTRRRPVQKRGLRGADSYGANAEYETIHKSRSDSVETPPPPAAPPAVAPQPDVKTIQIPASKVESLLGYHGETLLELTRSSGARLLLGANKDDASTFDLEIHGAAPEVELAIELLVTHDILVLEPEVEPEKFSGFPSDTADADVEEPERKRQRTTSNTSNSESGHPHFDV